MRVLIRYPLSSIPFKIENMAIKIPAEKKRQVIYSIRKYFAENLEEEIGDLKADLILDFILKEIGPTVYNQAVSDAQVYFQDKTNDLELTVYENDLGYWSKSS